MHRQFRFSLFSFLVVCSLITVAVGMYSRPRTAALSVQVVGNTYNPEPFIVEQGSKRRGLFYFHVVVQNTSNETIRLWEEWNSWGYYNLTFEVFDVNGKLLGVAQKKPQNWTVNFPSFLELKPKQVHVIDVYFHSFDWDAPIKPILANQAKSKYSLVANYSIAACSDSAEHGVWNGVSKARPIDITLECWPTDADAGASEPNKASEVDE